MNLGAEPKKVAVLGGLLLVALLVFLFNGGSGSGAGDSSPARPSGAAPSTAALPGASAGGGSETAAGGTSTRPRNRTTAEFRPRLPKGKDRPDPMSIDPTLRLDLLARLQTVEVGGMRRSLFDFSQPPAPKPDPTKLAAAKPPVPSPIVPVQAKPETPAGPPPKPSAPPVPLRFFGYVNAAGEAQKRAFFLEGEEIHVVREGELVKRRYKIVRIGVNSVVVQDVNFPDATQTLPLEEQPG